MEERVCKVLQIGEYSIFVDVDVGDIIGVVEIANNKRFGIMAKEILPSKEGSILYFEERITNQFTLGGKYLLRIWNLDDYFYLKVFRGINWNIKR